MSPLDPEEMTPDELTEELDTLQEQIAETEGKPAFQNYLELKDRQDRCAIQLRTRATEVGPFRTKFFHFQCVEQDKTDWKAICRYLLEQKMVLKKDMSGAIEAFTEKKSIGKMLKIKEKDLSVKLV